ncbi:pyruvate kinase 1, cytosolic-like protein [Tanacetum coccineum]
MSKLLYTRFTKLIIDYLLSLNKSIPRRSDSKLHSLQDDHLITKLLNTTNGEYKFGMEVLDAMTSDEIKKKAGYKYYKSYNLGSDTNLSHPQTGPPPGENGIRCPRAVVVVRRLLVVSVVMAAEGEGGSVVVSVVAAAAAAVGGFGNDVGVLQDRDADEIDADTSHESRSRLEEYVGGRPKTVNPRTFVRPFYFPSMTKIVGTLGPKSRSVDVISKCLMAGMSVARFDFTWGDAAFHQETLENLKIAIKKTKKLCAVMLDTTGPELLVVNKADHPIPLEADSLVVLTPDQEKEASSNLLPINFNGLAKAVKSGDTIFLGQYLFTGSETTSVWLEVKEVKGDDVVCLIKNSAVLAGTLYTLHASQIHIDLPTLNDKDKEVISMWGAKNNVNFLSLSHTRSGQDIREAREYLSKLGDLSQTQIFAKIENVEGLVNFDEILQEADGIILARGNLGIDLPPEKVSTNLTISFLFTPENVK